MGATEEALSSETERELPSDKVADLVEYIVCGLVDDQDSVSLDVTDGDEGALIEVGCSEEKLLRALTLANLLSLHQKRYIGNLSAYCGAVSAGTAAACGVAYLYGEGYDVIGRTIVNSLGNVGGIVCDGAKASCAAKIASAVNSGLLGYEMAKRSRVFPFGEGLVEEDYEHTIRNFGRLGKDGMKSTDVEILNMMIGK